MQYLLFGGTGFLGQHIGQKILATTPDAKIKVVSREPERYKGNLSFPCEFISLKNYLRDSSQFISEPTHVINLTGAGVMDKRWSPTYKKILRDSRVEFSKNIIKSSEKISQHILSWVQASGIGYYGNTSTKVTESSPVGSGFLAKLSVDWEDTIKDLPKNIKCSAVTVSYTHLTLPTKRIV